MLPLYLVLSFIAGAGLAWLLLAPSFRSKQNQSQLEFERRLNASEGEKIALAERVKAGQERQAAADMKSETAGKQLGELQAAFAKEQENSRHLTEKLGHQKQELENLQQQLKTEFENLANRILEEKSLKFTEQNRANLDIILNPLKEKIRDFETKVEHAYKTESAERNSLKGEIKSLVDLNRKLSEEASQLTLALKGDTKQQGNWGELVLERVLESSGLLLDREYSMQVASTNQDGERIILDAVIQLPDDKQLIIDSKVSLLSYQALVNCTDQEEADRLKKAHLLSVRTHVKNLSGKQYQTANGFFTPDFVLMFIPIESSFGVAVQSDQDLFNYAWERKIVIVSPSTLLATLRTVASIWKQERQTQHALEIAAEGGMLYDKLVGFAKDLDMIGQKIDDAKNNYSEAKKKLTDGTGNLVRRAEKMKELGAKATKNLPQEWIEKAGQTG